jgi:hypothetical protein
MSLLKIEAKEDQLKEEWFGPQHIEGQTGLLPNELARAVVRHRHPESVGLYFALLALGDVKVLKPEGKLLNL